MALLIGGKIYTSVSRETQLMLDEEAEVERALRSLDKQPDPVSLLTIYCLIAWFLFFKRRIPDAQAYLSKAYAVVVQYGLSLNVQDYDGMLNPGEPTEDMKEWVTALCELAYLDKAATLVLKVQPLLPSDFDRQLKLLPVCCLPAFFCPLPSIWFFSVPGMIDS